MPDANDSPPSLALVPLDRAELIEISGADAIAFAHAQFASDVAGLDVGAWQWSAWLNAQGRTRAVFALLRVAPDHLLLWLPLGGARGDARCARALRAARPKSAGRARRLVARAGSTRSAGRPLSIGACPNTWADTRSRSRVRNACCVARTRARDRPMRNRARGLASRRYQRPGCRGSPPRRSDEFVPQALDLAASRCGALRQGLLSRARRSPRGCIFAAATSSGCIASRCAATASVSPGTSHRSVRQATPASFSIGALVGTMKRSKRSPCSATHATLAHADVRERHTV